MLLKLCFKYAKCAKFYKNYKIFYEKFTFALKKLIQNANHVLLTFTTLTLTHAHTCKKFKNIFITVNCLLLELTTLRRQILVAFIKKKLF